MDRLGHCLPGMHPSSSSSLEAAAREAVGGEGSLALLAGHPGHVSLLYRCRDTVAKIVARESVFWPSHVRELDFYSRTQRFPYRGVHGDVLLLHFLRHGRFPDQMAGLSVVEMRRIVGAAAEAHASIKVWDSLSSVRDTVLGYAHGFAAPLADGVTEKRIRELGICPGRECEALQLMQNVMQNWSSLAGQLEAPPCVVVHGDLRGENVFLPSNADEPAVLLDWQLVCRGSPFVDLAYLLASSMTVPDRRTHEMPLLQLYFGRIDDAIVSQYRLALQWPVIWAVFVCGGGVDGLDKKQYHVTVAHRFLSAALDHTKE